MSRTLGRLRPVDGAIVIVTVIAVSLAMVHWDRIFSDSGYSGPIVIASLGGSALAVLAARAGFRSAATTAIGVAALIIGLAAWYGTSIDELPNDLVDSWKGLASTGLLIPTSRAFLIVPVIVSFAGAWVITDIAVRRRIGAAVALPLGIVHGTALAYTIGQGASPWWYAVAVGVAMLALILLSTVDRPLVDPALSADEPVEEADTTGTAIRWPQLLKSIPIILAVAAGGAVLNELLVDRDEEAFDLRERLVRPLDVFEASTPLARVKGGLVEPAPTSVFTIRVEGLGPDDQASFITVATLDDYDGAVWTSSARFEAAGASLPLPAQVGARQPEVVIQAVELTDNYPFRFLPRVGVVLQSGEGEIGWDPRSGSIARTDDPNQSLRFVTTQALPDRDISGAVIEEAPDTVRYAATPPTLADDQLPVFGEFLDETTSGAETELERLLLLEAALFSEEFGYNEEAPAGHSLAALTSYLRPSDADGTEAPRVGFAEQSASVFAVLARQLGVPSRVVVGYRLPTPLTADAAQAVVTEDMIHAWPEVWVSGVGWTRFEPTNVTNETAEQTARTPAVSAEGQEAQVTDLPELQDPVLIPEPVTTGGSLTRWAFPILLALLPIIYILAMLIGKRLRRSRRRRKGDPSDRTVGAWLETRDRLGALGLPADRSDSVMDIADELDLRELTPVADEVATMAPLVDRALYAPGGEEEASAKAAWNAADAAISAASKSQPVGTRVKAALRPTSLVGR